MVNTDEGRQIAQVIEAARRSHRPKLSVRAAADLAGISEGWWRQLAAGYQRRGDTEVPVVGSPETYLAMADVVGVRTRIQELLGEEAPADLPPSSLPDGDGRASSATEDAIRNDPRLMEAAKEHLLRQYDLLAQLSDLTDTTGAAKTSPPERPLRVAARPRPGRRHREGEERGASE